MKRNVFALPVWMMFVAGLLAASPARASDVMRAGLSQAVKETAEFLKRDRKTDTVAIPEVKPRRRGRAAGGHLNLSRTVTQLLLDNKIRVVPEAEYAIEVLYDEGRVPSSDEVDGDSVAGLKVTIIIVFMDQNIQKFDATVKGQSEVLAVIGRSVDLGGAPTEDDVQDRILVAGRNPPTIYLEGTVVKASEKSPYGLEVLLSGNGVEPANLDGVAVVNLPKDKPFRVRLKNSSEREAAVDLRLDGLSVFALSEEVRLNALGSKEPIYSHYIIPSRSSVIVPGWHLTNETADQFIVTELPTSVAAELGKVGPQMRTITAIFAASWPEGERPPADEPARSRGTPNAGIGRGGRERSKAEPVARRIGLPRAAVTLRYEEAAAKSAE